MLLVKHPDGVRVSDSNSAGRPDFGNVYSQLLVDFAGSLEGVGGPGLQGWRVAGLEGCRVGVTLEKPCHITTQLCRQAKADPDIDWLVMPSWITSTPAARAS